MTFQFSSTMANAAAETPAQRDRQQAQQQQEYQQQQQLRASNDNDIDALLIQYKRNNIGFPFPHPLRSVVYSCQFTVDSQPVLGLFAAFFLLPAQSIQYNSLSELLEELLLLQQLQLGWKNNLELSRQFSGSGGTLSTTMASNKNLLAKSVAYEIVSKPFMHLYTHTHTNTSTTEHNTLSLRQAPCNWMHVDNDGNLCKVQATPASSANPATEIVARSAINRALAAFFFLCLVILARGHWTYVGHNGYWLDA